MEGIGPDGKAAIVAEQPAGRGGRWCVGGIKEEETKIAEEDGGMRGDDAGVPTGSRGGQQSRIPSIPVHVGPGLE